MFGGGASVQMTNTPIAKVEASSVSDVLLTNNVVARTKGSEEDHRNLYT